MNIQSYHRDNLCLRSYSDGERGRSLTPWGGNEEYCPFPRSFSTSQTRLVDHCISSEISPRELSRIEGNEQREEVLRNESPGSSSDTVESSILGSVKAAEDANLVNKKSTASSIFEVLTCES